MPNPDLNIPVHGIIGKDFLKPHGCDVNLNSMLMYIPSANISMKIYEEKIGQTETHFNTISNVNRVSKLINALSKNCHQFLSNICLEYEDNLDNLDDEKLTTNNFYSYKIILSDNTPVFEKNYRVPQTQTAEIMRQVDILFKNGQIQKSIAPYNSPTLLVPKNSINGAPQWRLLRIRIELFH